MLSTAEEQKAAAPRTRRKGATHDRIGCLTCRHRRKKCVENTLPVCGACRRLNLECVRPPVRRLVTLSASAETSHGSDGLATGDGGGPVVDSPSALLLARSPHPWRTPLNGDSEEVSRLDVSQRRYAMSYYITVLALHLTVSEQSNSFLSVFLPMAMESVPLWDALVAFAAGHLALVDSSYQIAALEARSAATRGLTAAIDMPLDMIAWHETNAAACLALLTAEICLGDHVGTWYAHLVAAKHIITSSKAGDLHGPAALKRSPEGRWMLRNFAYHDIVGSVTLGRRPLLDDCGYLDDISDVVDSYLGVATPLLRFVARIRCLDEDTRLDVGPMDDHEVCRRRSLLHGTCAGLERELLGWQCPGDTPRGLEAVAYALRSAVLILFYRLVRSRLRNLSAVGGPTHGDHHPHASPLPVNSLIAIVQAKIRIQVESTLDHVSHIPLGDAPESALLFPLFLAGGEATEEAQMDVVRTRLSRTLEKRRFRNILQAMGILEELWRRRVEEGDMDADWADVLEASGVDLVLT